MVWTVEGTVFCLCVLKNTEDQEGARQLAQLLVVLWEEGGNVFVALAADFGPVATLEPSGSYVRERGEEGAGPPHGNKIFYSVISPFFSGEKQMQLVPFAVQRGSRRTVQSGRGGSLRRRARRGAMRMCLRIALLECSRVRKKGPGPLLCCALSAWGGHLGGGGGAKARKKR